MLHSFAENHSIIHVRPAVIVPLTHLLVVLLWSSVQEVDTDKDKNTFHKTEYKIIRKDSPCKFLNLSLWEFHNKPLCYQGKSQVIATYWHFLCGPTTEQSLEFSLTEDYCRNHFLVGLLLREVAEALQQGPDVRQLAVSVLKNLLIKHALDERYTAYKVRISTLWLPCKILMFDEAQV